MDMAQAFRSLSLDNILRYCVVLPFHGFLKLCQILIGFLASVIGSCLFSANNGFCEAVYKYRTVLFGFTVVYAIIIAVLYYTTGIRTIYRENPGRPYATAIDQMGGLSKFLILACMDEIY